MYYIEKLTKFTKRDVTLMHVAPAFIVFLAFSAITIWSFLDVQSSLKNEQEQILNRNVAASQEAIEKRMDSYEDLLNASTGLYDASDSVSRQEWSKFINIFQLPQRFGGIEGIGYIQLVPHSDLAAHEGAIRTNDYPAYQVFPVTNNRTHANVIYIEPMTERNARAIGYDMYSDSTRKLTMDEARDTGVAAMTNRLRFIQDPEKWSRPGIVMFIPLYHKNTSISTVQERRANISSFIYGQLYTDSLLGEVFDQTESNYAFKIYDKSTKNGAELYQSPNFDQVTTTDGNRQISRDFQVNNRTWSITGAINPAIISASERNRPTTVLWGGLLFSTFLAGFIYLLLLNRSRAMLNKEEGELQSAKDELLALASHQLRTPATGVKQYIGMLREGYAGKLTKQQRQYIDEAYESNERQLRTINEMLVVAQADAGRIKLSFDKTDLKSIVEDILKEHKQKLKQHRLKLRTIMPKRRIMIQADGQYLRMAIENIVNNASKYTPDGGHVTVTLNRQKNFVELAVSDTGVGVGKKDFPLLFRKFSRIPNELTRKVGGTGIGLYLAKKIVDTHGGEIIFSSNERIGSTCTIRLPIRRTAKSKRSEL